MSLRTASPTAWPELLEACHIGEILGCSVRSAQRKVASGKLGPFIELDGKRYIRKPVFQKALAALEITPMTRPRRRRLRPGIS